MQCIIKNIIFLRKGGVSARLCGRRFKMSEIKQIKIADGVDACFVVTDRFKTSKVLVTMAMPLKGYVAARAALPFVLRRSCRKYPDFSSLNGYLDELYGASLQAGVEKLGEAHLVKMGISVIGDRFTLDGESVAERAVELLFDLIFDPKLENGIFDPSDVEIEKRLLAERMVSELDDKRVYAVSRCQELMCEGEAFGKNRYGELSEIESLTPKRVFDAWRGVLKSAVIRVVVAGDSDTDKIEKMLSDKFSEIERSPSAISTSFIKSARGERYFSEEQPVKQGKLVMGFRAGMESKDDYRTAMTVMSDIFGGGTYSRLFLNVREKMSLCYYCGSRLNREKGIMIVQSGIETENEEKMKTAILEQLDALRAGDFTKETLEASMLSINETLRAYGDSPDALCSWYSAQLLDEVIKTPDERAAEFNAVTFDEVCGAAKEVTLDTVFMLIGTEGNSDGN